MACLVLTASAFAGCGGAKYSVYTNFPAGEIKLVASGFSMEEGLAPSSFTMQKPPAADGNFTYKSEEYYHMNAHSELIVRADFSDAEKVNKFNAFKEEVGNILYELDLSLSATQEGSSVSKFNAAEAGARVRVDESFYNAVSVALNMHSFTEGSYNPAVYDCVKAFGFLGRDRPATVSDLPSDEKCAALARVASHFSEIELTAENGAYYAVKPQYSENIEGAEYNLKLDLGGIGKGYAVDIIDGLFDKYGFEYGYFNFASSSMACRQSAKEGSYTIGLRNPRGTGDNYVKFAVSNAKISTSGDYFLSYSLEGKRYCSIISPQTGKPIDTGVITATVVGGSAAENDALTTALMVMGREKAAEFISEKLNGRRAVFVCEKV